MLYFYIYERANNYRESFSGTLAFHYDNIFSSEL